MSDVIVTDSTGQTGPADSAHEAAVAEGQTQVHAENAAMAASEAEAAASQATAALESQATIAETAVQAAEEAQSHASETQATSEAMYELMQQQNTTLQALAAKLLAEPEPEPEPEVESEPEPETSPARKTHWYYRKMRDELYARTHWFS